MDLLEEALKLVNAGKLIELFEFLKEHNISTPNLSTLEKDYDSGAYRTCGDYNSRLKKNLRNALDNESLSTSENLAEKKFMVPNYGRLELGLIRSTLESNPETFRSFFEGVEWKKNAAAKLRYHNIVSAKPDSRSANFLKDLYELCKAVFKEIRSSYEADKTNSWHFLDRKKLRRALKKELKEKFDGKREFQLFTSLFLYDEDAMVDEIPNMLYSWYKDWADSRDGGLKHPKVYNLAAPLRMNSIEDFSEEQYIDEEWKYSFLRTLKGIDQGVSSEMTPQEALGKLRPETRIFYQKVSCPEPSKLDYLLNKWLSLGPWPFPAVLILIVVNTKDITSENKEVWYCKEEYYELINRINLEDFCHNFSNYKGHDKIFKGYEEVLPLRKVLCHQKLVFTS